MTDRRDRRQHGLRYAPPDPLPTGWLLTREEWRIAEMIAAGHSYPFIARQTDRSVFTTMTHARNLARKLRDLPGSDRTCTRKDCIVAFVQRWGIIVDNRAQNRVENAGEAA